MVLSHWVTLTLFTARSFAQGSLADYAPSFTKCPDTALVREFTPASQTLNPSESKFIAERESHIIPQSWESWLGDGSSIGYRTSEFTDFARVGIAFSGGGLRASQYGAGAISAIDARNKTAAAVGTGGLLQVASYFSGLSGGTWLTAGLYMNNFPTVQDMVLGSQPGWLMENDILFPANASDPLAAENLEYYSLIAQSIDAKAAAGFIITDEYGTRMLSYHFLSGTNASNFFDNSSHGAGQLWSQIAESTFFVNKEAPFPVVLINSNGTFDLTTQSTSLDLPVYEVSPFEFASFDPSISAGADLTFIGTSLSQGVPTDNSSCVVGFDQASFVIGSSSNIFLSVQSEPGGTTSVEELQLLLGAPVNTENPDVAIVSKWPNPFFGIAPSTFVDSNNTELNLIDGGFNGEGLPLNPLLVKARGVEVIVAVEGTADTADNWPNGMSFLFSQERLSTMLADTHQQLPDMPVSADDFVAQGLNLRPTFFGCNNTDTPFVIFLPNSPPLTGAAPFANGPTTQTQFEANETQAILDQTFNNTIGGFVPNTNSPDPNWPGCLKCAAVDRSRFKAYSTIERSAFCETCFTQYCYNPNNLTSAAELPNRQLTYAGPASTAPVQVR
ncbi:lysophospholipase [Rhodocollybia butyracea]|uniref:Lysophospholipase n=1 Tax=Rhodocollybia butyracea TaxID=206335 RepID=A0A9P5PH13_9AGAR|nr:lysophospholipase [Rhodocollybia butyracea]